MDFWTLDWFLHSAASTSASGIEREWVSATVPIKKYQPPFFLFTTLNYGHLFELFWLNIYKEMFLINRPHMFCHDLSLLEDRWR